MEYFCPIEIDLDPLTSRAKLWLEKTKKENFNGDKSFRLPLAVQLHINPALVDFYKQHNFFIKFAEIFYTAIHRESLIHSDGNPDNYSAPDNMGKINHVTGGNDSLMNWYQPRINKTFSRDNSPKNKYISYDIDEVECIHSAYLQGYNIVQVAPPHNVSNHVSQRICTSMTIRSMDQPNLMPTYQLLVDTFGALTKNRT
jgi:hypothetical protein